MDLIPAGAGQGSRITARGSQKKSSSFIFQVSQKKQRLFRPDVSRIVSADRRGLVLSQLISGVKFSGAGFIRFKGRPRVRCGLV